MLHACCSILFSPTLSIPSTKHFRSSSSTCTFVAFACRHCNRIGKTFEKDIYLLSTKTLNPQNLNKHVYPCYNAVKNSTGSFIGKLEASGDLIHFIVVARDCEMHQLSARVS